MKEACSDYCTLFKRGCDAQDPVDMHGQFITRSYLDCVHYSCGWGQRSALEAFKAWESNTLPSESIEINGFIYRAVPFGSPEKPFTLMQRHIIVDGDEIGRIVTTKSDGHKYLSAVKVRINN